LFDTGNNSLTLRDLELSRSTNLAQVTGGAPLARFSSDGQKVLLYSFMTRKDYSIDLPSFVATVLLTHSSNPRQDTVFNGTGTAEVFFNQTNLSLVSLTSTNTTLIAETLPTPKSPYPSARATLDNSGRLIAYSNYLFRDQSGTSTNNYSDIFLFDAATQTNLLLSRVAASANGPSVLPKISENGRIVAFQSAALNLSMDESSFGSDIYIYRIPVAESEEFHVSILESLLSGDFIVSWESVPGASYLVEFKPMLSATSWTALGAAVTATDTVSSVRDPNGSAERYYRIQKQP
jgi:hypothetical protein